MASGVGNKYHVALAQVDASNAAQTPVGYLLRGNGYQKQDADTFAPRFNTGEQGLNDLDLWKTMQITDFSGGMFQQKFEDTTKCLSVIGAIPSPVNGLLYQVPSPTPGTMASGAVSMVNQTAWYIGSLYMIINKAATGAIYLWTDSTKTVTAVKTDFATAVSGIVVVNNILWVATSGGLFWAYDGTTWTSQGSFGVTSLMGFDDAIYCNGTSSTSDRGKLWKHPNTIGAAGTAIGNVGDVNKSFNSMAVFNHRLYIGKPDGLFAYDGVQISCILDYSNDNSNSNFTSMVAAGGILYFMIKNTLYKFTGTSIEKIRDFGADEYVIALSVAYDRLWIMTQNTIGTVGSRFYYYNGVGFFCYAEFTSNDFPAVPVTPVMVGFADTGSRLLLGFTGKSGSTEAAVFHVDTTKEYTTGQGRDVVFTTSEFDGGFPYIDKFVDGITVTTEGGLVGDTITTLYSIYDGSSWGAYTTVVPATYKRIKVKVTLTRSGSTSALALKSISMKYALSPDMKRKWGVTLLCQGTTDNGLELLDGTIESLKPKELREQIYQCRINDTPSLFEDIDTCVLSGSHSNSVTTITVDSTAAFPPAGYIKVDNEYISYTAKTATTFTGCVRGLFGSSAASHSSAAIVGTVYRVVISKISSERVVIPNNTDGLMDVFGNESEMVLQLQEA